MVIRKLRDSKSVRNKYWFKWFTQRWLPIPKHNVDEVPMTLFTDQEKKPLIPQLQNKQVRMSEPSAIVLAQKRRRELCACEYEKQKSNFLLTFHLIILSSYFPVWRIHGYYFTTEEVICCDLGRMQLPRAIKSLLFFF